MKKLQVHQSEILVIFWLSTQSELLKTFAKYKDTKKTSRQNMKRKWGQPEKLSLYDAWTQADAWNLADGELPKRRKIWEVIPFYITPDGKPIEDPELGFMDRGEELVYMRDHTKDQAWQIRTQHTQHNKLLDQFWKQNAELVALKQNMNVMKENAVNDTLTLKHLRAVIAIQRKWDNEAQTLKKEIEDMKLELIECKKNKRTPTEMQHAELQRLKKVHDASRAPMTDEEKQVVLKAVEAADARETQQELEAAGIVCLVCSTARNLVSLPCCNHVQEVCTQCYAKAPIRNCPLCRGSTDTWTDRDAYASGDDPSNLD